MVQLAGLGTRALGTFLQVRRRSPPENRTLSEIKGLTADSLLEARLTPRARLDWLPRSTFGRVGQLQFAGHE